MGNLEKPQDFGLENVHNFYMSTEKDVKIGIWHFIPKDMEVIEIGEFNNNLYAVEIFRRIHGFPFIIFFNLLKIERLRHDVL